jgi:UDP-glucose 4-epimerase
MNNYILIAGGLGYIGSHAVVNLLNHNLKVVVVDNLSNAEMDVKESIEKITGKEIELHIGDIRDENFLNEIFEKYKIEAVIDFAGYKVVTESIENPLKYFDNNLTGLISLLKVMKRYKCSNIIFSSSATVYGLGNLSPLNENMKQGVCTNVYGMTKQISEAIIKETVRSNDIRSAVSLRYFNPVGAHESYLIGENPKNEPGNLMPRINLVADGKIDKLYIYGSDYDTCDGTAVRDYIHVEDLAEGHYAALKFCDSHQGYEIFNLGTGKGHTVLELISTFEKINKVKVKTEIAGRRPGDIDIAYADVNKAETILGWKAQKNLETMCQDSWCFYQKMKLKK